MTPKQKYDERKRLRIENALRAEQRRKEQMDKQDEMEAIIISIANSLERIANVLELWGDLQND